MWWRIVGFTLLPLMILSLFLSFRGVVGVPSGDSFMTFFRMLQRDVAKWKIEIPKIPELPTNADFKKLLSNVVPEGGLIEIIVQSFVNMVERINAIIRFINIIIAIINSVVQLIQFIITFILNFSKLLDSFPHGTRRTPFYNPFA